MYNSNNGILEFNPQNKFDTQKSTAKIAPNIFMKRNGSVPVADIGERLLVCDIVHEENAHGAAIVGGGDGAKPLRAGSVPNLQFAALVIDFDSADLEVDADGGNKGIKGIIVVSEAEQQVALARALVSYYQQLDKVVIISLWFCSHLAKAGLRGAMVNE